jgi:very-short-patch-repair endonuclease
VNVEGVFRRQAGVISRQQALKAGLSARQIDRRLEIGRWVQLHPCVYLAADRERTDEIRIRAAGLWAGEPSTISGLAAAWWHGLSSDPPELVEITVPAHRRLQARPGIRIRRRNLTEPDRVGIRDLWVTALPLTVLEAAVTLGERGSELVDRALQRRVRFDALHRAQCRNSGRRGSTASGRLLTAAADHAASAAERKMINLLRADRLTGWVQHYRLNGYEVDLAFSDQRVAIEVDGWAWHHDQQTFRRDRQRQNAMALSGWTVLRFTWHDLVQRPDQVVGEIRAATA